MDLAGFKASLSSDVPHDALSPPLVSLWWVAKGDWKKAHEVAQQSDDRTSAWVHAHLHRVEGDLSNAGYWYRRARRDAETGPLQAEWDTIATALLQQERTD